MSDLNRCEFIGRLGADPELRYTGTNQPVVNLSLAVNRTYTDASGNRVQSTEWVPIVVFGRLTEVVMKYTKKGSRVFVSGRLNSRKWTDKYNEQRTTVEILLAGPDSVFQMID